MQLVWCLCVLGIALVLVDLLGLLAELPAHWWQAEQPPQVTDGGMQFELRGMEADFGLGWLGSWGYMGSFFWLAVAAAKWIRGNRAGLVPDGRDRVMVLVLVALLCAISALVHLTPLRYPSYNIFLL